MKIRNIWMTICHGIPWYRNGADDHCPFSIEVWWLFFYPLSYWALTLFERILAVSGADDLRKSVNPFVQINTPSRDYAAPSYQFI